MLRLCFLTMAVFMTGCATVHHGPMQRIHVDSEPPAATVMTRDCGTRPKSVTAPAVLWVSRRATQCELTFSMTGYEPAVIVLRREVSKATDDNFALANESESFKGFVGGLLWGATTFAIDVVSGAMYELQPSRVLVQLTPSRDSADTETAPTAACRTASAPLRAR